MLIYRESSLIAAYNIAAVLTPIGMCTICTILFVVMVAQGSGTLPNLLPLQSQHMRSISYTYQPSLHLLQHLLPLPFSSVQQYVCICATAMPVPDLLHLHECGIGPFSQ